MTIVMAIIAWNVLLVTIARRGGRARRLSLRKADRWFAAVTFGGAAIPLVSHVDVSVGIGLVSIAVAANVDAQTGYIFDSLTVAGVFGVTVAATLEGRALDSVGGALAAAGTMSLIWAITRGRGLGVGDVKLSALVGAAFGPLGGVTAIGLSFITGACVAVVRIFAGKARFGMSVRFGPYVLAGSVCLLAYHRLSDGVFR